VPKETLYTYSEYEERGAKKINHRIRVHVGLSQMYFVHRHIESDFYVDLFIFSEIFLSFNVTDTKACPKYV